ncbi:hypothetical protein N9C00_00095 [Flavobacteriales bacterium]|nr:hypothetical protein [Flavobacteriales bacterium]
MHNNLLLLTICTLITLTSYSQEKSSSKVKDTHRYGGWYCPDNLNGFPAVDIDFWDSVPVVNDRLPTQEEASNGTSLMYIDPEEYPDAVALNMTMPKLATYYNGQSGRDELIIVIQAVSVLNDSIVGFRYLNGGNGSAWISEVKFFSDEQVYSFPTSHFVAFDVEIDASPLEIFDVLTNEKYSIDLQTTFDREKNLDRNWGESATVNFKFMEDQYINRAFAGNVWGCQYIQIDFEKADYHYTEKFLLLAIDQTERTLLKISCGPYNPKDHARQLDALTAWSKKVQQLSQE